MLVLEDTELVLLSQWQLLSTPNDKQGTGEAEHKRQTKMRVHFLKHMNFQTKIFGPRRAEGKRLATSRLSKLVL